MSFSSLAWTAVATLSDYQDALAEYATGDRATLNSSRGKGNLNPFTARTLYTELALEIRLPPVWALRLGEA